MGGYIPRLDDELADFALQLSGHTLIGGVTGGMVAEMGEGDFGQGFAQGAWTAGYGYLFNAAAHKLIQFLEKGGHKVMGYLSKKEAIAARRAGQNVVSRTEAEAKALEVAARQGNRQGIMRHSGHPLSDENMGMPHYQTNGVPGHSFWNRSMFGAVLYGIWEFVDPLGATDVY